MHLLYNCVEVISWIRIVFSEQGELATARNSPIIMGHNNFLEQILYMFVIQVMYTSPSPLVVPHTYIYELWFLGEAAFSYNIEKNVFKQLCLTF